MSRWIVALFLSLVLPWAASAASAASAPPHDGITCVAADAAADEASIEAHVDTDASADPDLFDAAPQASASEALRGAPPRFRAAALAPPFLQGLRRPPRA
jgi:hypothetical protein